MSSVYYAQISSSGIGPWSSTTAYPVELAGQACVMDGGSMICVGGIPNFTDPASSVVYFATVSAGGVGSWQQGANYPVGIETPCVFGLGNLYCTGGYSSSSDAWSDFTFYVSVQTLLE